MNKPLGRRKRLLVTRFDIAFCRGSAAEAQKAKLAGNRHVEQPSCGRAPLSHHSGGDFDCGKITRPVCVCVCVNMGDPPKWWSSLKFPLAKLHAAQDSSWVCRF